MIDKTKPIEIGEWVSTWHGIGQVIEREENADDRGSMLCVRFRSTATMWYSEADVERVPTVKSLVKELAGIRDKLQWFATSNFPNSGKYLEELAKRLTIVIRLLSQCEVEHLV